MFGVMLPPLPDCGFWILDIECACGHEFKIRCGPSTPKDTVTDCPNCGRVGNLDAGGLRVEGKEALMRPKAQLYFDDLSERGTKTVVGGF